MKRFVANAAALTIFAMPLAGAAAEPEIDDRTQCTVAQTIMDVAMPEQDRRRKLTLYIANQLALADEKAGSPSLLAIMNHESKQSFTAVVIAHCGNEPKTTIRDAVNYVYDSWRSMSNANRIRPEN
jgi:hypothetical protein